MFGAVLAAVVLAPAARGVRGAARDRAPVARVLAATTALARVLGAVLVPVQARDRERVAARDRVADQEMDRGVGLALMGLEALGADRVAVVGLGAVLVRGVDREQARALAAVAVVVAERGAALVVVREVDRVRGVAAALVVGAGLALGLAAGLGAIPAVASVPSPGTGLYGFQ